MKSQLNPKLLELTFYSSAIDLFDLTWDDCDRLQSDRRGWAISDQIIRSCGSISANIEEGYGRESSKEYLRFLRIARGSALETQGWYHRGRRLLGEELVKARMDCLGEIIGKLSGTINTLKNRVQ